MSMVQVRQSHGITEIKVYIRLRLVEREEDHDVETKFGGSTEWMQQCYCMINPQKWDRVMSSL